jgi:hypothetical protein
VVMSPVEALTCEVANCQRSVWVWSLIRMPGFSGQSVQVGLIR